MAYELKILTELDNRNFVPGEVVSGKVAWRGGTSSPGSNGPEAAELRLFFYTSGKGGRDVEVVATYPLVGIGAFGESPFRLAIPETSPPSFSGKLVSVEWALEFQVETSGETVRLDITVSPTGEEINLYKYDDGNLPDYTDFSIGRKGRKKRR